ncbi:hypothetical protein ACGFRB_14850 [Streptomyces sp. NPDC048718]|uniref:hypothetical protein n=1 Tax=Streptomyces sp. NPDC048718 TaxID=3365587 RepID=UPI0037129E39
MRSPVRYALAVLLVFAALLGAGAGAGPAIPETETRSAAVAADPSPETHDEVEDEDAVSVRGVRCPALPGRPWRLPAALALAPILVPLPPVQGEGASRSTVMRC